MTTHLQLADLEPGPDIELAISDLRIPVARASVQFDRATQHNLGDAFGGKPVLFYDGTPMFAELAIQRKLVHAGWQSQ